MRPSTYEVEEQATVPTLSLVLGYGPMLPFAVGAISAWFLPPAAAAFAIHATLLWGGAILAFLAGVRRGLAFRAPLGETFPQLATMAFLFVLALGALLIEPSKTAAAVLVAGFLSVAAFDVLAARKEEVPPYFARLRPPQMLIALISLLVLLPRA